MRENSLPLALRFLLNTCLDLTENSLPLVLGFLLNITSLALTDSLAWVFHYGWKEPREILQIYFLPVTYAAHVYTG